MKIGSQAPALKPTKYHETARLKVMKPHHPVSSISVETYQEKTRKNILIIEFVRNLLNLRVTAQWVCQLGCVHKDCHRIYF